MRRTGKDEGEGERGPGEAASGGRTGLRTSELKLPIRGRNPSSCRNACIGNLVTFLRWPGAARWECGLMQVLWDFPSVTVLPAVEDLSGGAFSWPPQLPPGFLKKE